MIAVASTLCAGAAAGPTRRAAPAIAFLREAAGAVGGEAWARAGTVVLDGTVASGGATGTFHEVLEPRSGKTRLDINMGGFQDIKGYDGEPWTSQNGIVTPIDLPSLVADARTAAFIESAAWRRGDGAGHQLRATGRSAGGLAEIHVHLKGGSPATLWFDKSTHLLVRVASDTDAGIETSALSDYRGVGDLRIPFKRQITDPSGVVAVITIATARHERVSNVRLARPAIQRHGELDRRASGRVPFKFTAIDRGHIVAPASVNGRPVNVIFDSGGVNYFTPESARALGLKTSGGVVIAGVGEGVENGGSAPLESIAIGGAVLRDEQAIVGPLPYVALRPRQGLSIAGLTGYEFLSEFQTTIDYERRELSFAPFGVRRAGEGVSLPFYSDGHSIYVAATVEGAKGLFRVDTGDGGTLTVIRKFANAHGLFRDRGRTVIEAGGVGGAVASVDVMAKRLAIAGTTLRDVPVSVSDTKAGAFFSRSIAGNLGSGILDRFKVTFDYGARTITLRPNASATRAFARDRSGLSVSQSSPDALDVLSVADGSPASRAGMMAGDRITAVDGRSVSCEGIGAMDLTPLRYGNKGFELTVDRGGRKLELLIRPSAY